MPQHHHCCIPGCSREVSAQEKAKGRRIFYTHFSAPHPKFARNKEDREWREDIMKIILGYRDPKNTQILKQYHKDQVRVCERHFLDEDITVAKRSGGNGKQHKRLRLGALPLQNLPKKGGQLLPNPYARTHLNKERRKPPADRASKPIIKHKTFASLVAVAKRLSLCKSPWDVDIEDTIIKLTKTDERHDQSHFNIWIKDDFKIGISCYSWCLPEGHPLCNLDLHIDTLQTFLKQVESWKPCKGVIVPIGVKESDLVPHVLTVKTEPFSLKTPSSSVLAQRLRECKVLVSPEEDHCSSCSQRNKDLVQKWCENQLAMQIPHGKRPSTFKVEEFIQKRLKYDVKETNDGLQAILDVEIPVPEENIVLPPKLDIPTKEDWLKPVLKYADLKEECSAVFRMHWDTQASKFYKSLTNYRVEKYVGIHYPKELLEFWSEVYQSGKAAYKRLAHSGLIVIPSCTHISNYTKKKLNNLENTITQVANTSSNLKEDCPSHDFDPPVMVASRNKGIGEQKTPQRTDLPSTCVGDKDQNNNSSKERQIQILLVGKKPGQQKLIPVPIIQSPSASGVLKTVRIVSVQQPTTPSIPTLSSPIATNFESLEAQQLANPSVSLIQPNGKIDFVNCEQSLQLRQSSGSPNLAQIQNIDFTISQPDFPSDWGSEVVVSAQDVDDGLS